MSSKPVQASRFPVLAVLCIALCGCMAPRAMVMPPANPLPVIPPSISPPPLPEPEVRGPAESAVAPPAMLMPGPLPMEATALRMRLGNPDFIRREMDTELWRYDAARCSVFFFMQQQGGMLRLRYTETLPRGMTMAADPACIAALEQRMAAAPTLMNAPVSPP